MTVKSTAPTSPPRDGHRVFDARDFRNALGCFCTGVTVITAAAANGQRVGLTANSFSSVSLNPPLVLWSLHLYSTSMPVFQSASHFCINVLSAEQGEIARHFAKPSEDKFEGIEWTAGLGGAPKLAHVLAQFQCRNSDRYYGGDHVIFLGAVEEYSYGHGEPLLFSRGSFGSFSGFP
jgi:flavin reductase (DIM6/NTAB) family NADH-FMN oxidoreductase RutF